MHRQEHATPGYVHCPFCVKQDKKTDKLRNHIIAHRQRVAGVRQKREVDPEDVGGRDVDDALQALKFVDRRKTYQVIRTIEPLRQQPS